MIQFCIGILVGFAIAAMVQVCKDNDNDRGVINESTDESVRYRNESAEAGGT